jgi:hypothetical protein
LSRVKGLSLNYIVRQLAEIDFIRARAKREFANNVRENSQLADLYKHIVAKGAV